MRVESLVGPADELPVKPLFTSARLVARDQQDRFALGIEGKGHAPHAIRCVKTELFHVGVTGTIERINTGPAQARPELLQKARMGENFRPHVLGQLVEFRLKFVADLNNPFHDLIMHYLAYAVKCMCSQRMPNPRAYRGISLQSFYGTCAIQILPVTSPCTNTILSGPTPSSRGVSPTFSIE